MSTEGGPRFDRGRFVLGAILVVSGLAAQSAAPGGVVGVVRLSRDTSIASLPATPGQTVFTGDGIAVGDGAAELALKTGDAVTLGHDTRVRFVSSEAATLALLERGDIMFSRSGTAPDFRVQTGNITVRPAGGARTRASVIARDGALSIAANIGALRVEGAGAPVEVPEGTGVRLFPDGGSPGGSPSTTAASGTATHWTKPVLCGLAGGAVGSIPVIVNQESASPGTGPYWTAIPGGAAAGLLICEIQGGGPKKPGPPSCDLSLTSNYPYRDRQNKREVETAWPWKYDLSWTSKNATGLNLTFTQFSEKPGGLGTEPPVHNSGPMQVPAGAESQPAPEVKTADWIEFTMAATGPGGQSTCSAELKIKPPNKPTCTLTRDPLLVYENQPQANLSWTSTSAHDLTMSPGGPLATGSGTMPVGGPGQPQLKVGHNVFTLTVSNAAGSSRCQTDIVMDPDPCGSAMRDLGVAVVMAKEAIDFDNVLTVATVGGLAGAKVALGSMGWISSKFNSAFKGLTGDGLVNAACEELARCKVRFGHADSGELVFFNRLGNPAAICKFNKNADGSVTSEGKMLVKSASDAIKEQLQNAVTPSKP